MLNNEDFPKKQGRDTFNESLDRHFFDFMVILFLVQKSRNPLNVETLSGLRQSGSRSPNLGSNLGSKVKEIYFSGNALLNIRQYENNRVVRALP